ncbi:MAG: hypothetical protein EZS28_033029, partial [Streblomastix strix]
MSQQQIGLCKYQKSSKTKQLTKSVKFKAIYVEKIKVYTKKSKNIDPRSVAKVPQILHDIGQLQTIEADPTITIEEADAGIQGYKGKVRQQRHYGGYDPNDLIESNREAQQLVNNLLIPESQQLTQQADADTNQNINARYNQPSHDISSRKQPSAPDQSIEHSDDQRMQLFGDNEETNKNLQYIGGLDWGQKPVHPWYGKYLNEPHKVVDYNVTDQGALNARQRKVLLSKEERLNMDRPKTHKVATKRIIASVKAQEQLKNKLGGKRNEMIIDFDLRL